MARGSASPATHTLVVSAPRSTTSGGAASAVASTEDANMEEVAGGAAMVGVG